MDRLGGLATLFDSSASLVHAETWLVQLAGVAAEGRKADKDLFEAVKETLAKLLPRGDETIIVKGGHVVVKIGTKEVPFPGLSDGCLTTLGWTIDLIARWSHQQKRTSNISPGSFAHEMRCIVLIDELDLHLHPHWQSDIVTKLRHAFPNTTFIATTHNPLTLHGTLPGEVYVVRRADDGSIDVLRRDLPSGIRADQILTGLGNVTLTGYNSEYSDRPFTEKQTIQDGFNDSPLRLNRFIKEQSAWTAKEIEERGRLLASTACAVWPPLVVDHGLVQEAELAELRARAAGFGVDNLEMAPDVRVLFDALQKAVVDLGTDVVELFGLKTVTYRVHDFFLEIIPRVNRVILLLAVEPEDCEPLPDQAWDLASSGFVIHATCTEDAGLGYTLKRVKDVPAAMKLVRIAYEKVSG